MKWVKIIVLFWIAYLCLTWVRGYERFALLDTLPLIHRRQYVPPEYELAALAMVGYAAWTFLNRREE